MGVRTKDRAVNEPRDPKESKPVIKPEPIDIHDGGYRGAHPDDISYPHEVYFRDAAYPGLQVQLKAFSGKRIKQLEQLARDYLFPLLQERGLRLATFAEKRSGGGRFGKRTLGVCFERNGEHAIILDLGQSHPSTVYTTVHEVAHIEEMNHGPQFKRVMGDALVWGITENDEYRTLKPQLLGFAKGDSYCPPTPPSGSWDSYADGAAGLLLEVRAAPQTSLAITISAAYGVEGWGFTPALLPERAASIDILDHTVVERYLDHHPEVLAPINDNGGFQWSTEAMAEELRDLHRWELTERGVGQNHIQGIVGGIDYRAAVRAHMDDIQPLLEAAVKGRRERGEVE